MASMLPFNEIELDGTTVGPSAFVSGSGDYREQGQDVATTTADGRIHRLRRAILRRARCRLRGNQVAACTSPTGLALPVVLRQGATTVASFDGLVTATWLDDRQETLLEIEADPQTA